jgi:hypothetical protein
VGGVAPSSRELVHGGARAGHSAPSVVGSPIRTPRRHRALGSGPWDSGAFRSNRPRHAGHQSGRRRSSWPCHRRPGEADSAAAPDHGRARGVCAQLDHLVSVPCARRLRPARPSCVCAVRASHAPRACLRLVAAASRPAVPGHRARTFQRRRHPRITAHPRVSVRADCLWASRRREDKANGR